MKNLLVTLSFYVFLMSCGKGSTTSGPPTDRAAVINLSSPSGNIVFPNGTTVQVTGTVSDPDGIKKVVMEIKHRTNGTIYNTQNVTLSIVSFHSFHWTWNVSGMTGATNATVKIVSTDRYDYQVSKEVDIQLDN